MKYVLAYIGYLIGGLYIAIGFFIINSIIILSNK